MTGERAAEVLRLAEIDRVAVAALLAGYGLMLQLLPRGEPRPGSYWGDTEAGLSGDVLYARPDTPLHSVLHEAAHFICMTPERRAGLDRDAGGDDAEECAVCWLQIALTQQLADERRVSGGRERAFADMDAWGYSFRLGSAERWFQTDADEAREWLAQRGLLPAGSRLDVDHGHGQNRTTQEGDAL
jgi:hypothetical protein